MREWPGVHNAVDGPAAASPTTPLAAENESSESAVLFLPPTLWAAGPSPVDSGLDFPAVSSPARLRRRLKPGSRDPVSPPARRQESVRPGSSFRVAPRAPDVHPGGPRMPAFRTEPFTRWPALAGLLLWTSIVAAQA